MRLFYELHQFSVQTNMYGRTFDQTRDESRTFLFALVEETD
jgi:hypothetical protein